MRLSIITINYNNIAGLKRTAESILSQTFRNFEWLIVDGGSTDGSRDVIESLANNPVANITYWCSEKDKGIYNAMNKGVKFSKGDYLNFMNSGDVFCDCETLKLFSEHSITESEIYYGDAIVLKNDGTVDYKLETPEHLSMEHYLYGGWISHQASYIKRQLLIDRPYDEKRFRTAADSDFFLYQLCHRTKFEHIAAVTVTCKTAEKLGGVIVTAAFQQFTCLHISALINHLFRFVQTACRQEQLFGIRPAVLLHQRSRLQIVAFTQKCICGVAVGSIVYVFPDKINISKLKRFFKLSKLLCGKRCFVVQHTADDSRQNKS